MKKYVAYYNRKARKLEKNIYIHLVISLDTFAFDCKILSAESAGVIYKKKAYRYYFQKLYEVVTVRAENETLREL